MKKESTARATERARVLVDARFGDITLKPNDVIEAPASIIKSLGDSVDSSADAVGFCIDQLGVQVIVLSDNEAE